MPMIRVWRAVFIPLLGMALFGVLLAMLALLQARCTLADPGIYASELRKADVYRFVLHDALTTALDEAREVETGAIVVSGIDGRDRVLFEENPLAASGLSTEDIVASVKRAAPPEWLQDAVEQRLDQLVNYMIGEREDFEVTIRADERASVLAEELKSLLVRVDAYGPMLEGLVKPEIERAAGTYPPLEVEVSAERLMESLRRVLGPDWVRDQVEAILDEVTPYLVGGRDTFAVNVQLADRAEAVLEEVKAILGESKAYEVLYMQVVESEVEKYLGEVVDLGLGIEVSSEEVIDALRRGARVHWVQEKAEAIIDGAAPYLAGRDEGFAVRVSVESNKREAAVIIEEAVQRRLDEVIDALPECDGAQAAQSFASFELPSCIPAGTRTSELIGRLEIDAAEQVQRLVLAPIPSEIVFTDRQLRIELEQAGAAEKMELIDRMRELLRDGWTYTQDDLRRDLARLQGEQVNGEEVDLAALLDDARDILKNGWTYTEMDFRDQITDAGGVQSLNKLDTVRSVLKPARSYWWLGWVPIALLLAAIGFLGGGGRRGRVAWGAGALLVSAALVFIVSGLGYDWLQPLEEARAGVLSGIEGDAPDFPQTAGLIVNKAFDVAGDMADDLASGVASLALGLAVLGLLVMAAAILWPRIASAMESLRSRR